MIHCSRMKMFPMAAARGRLLLLAPLDAQVFTFTKEQMLKYTAKNPFERFEDGRPKVPDAILEKCKGLSAEEVWAVLGREKSGFPNQYEGNWRILHPEKKLVGRAVTVQFMPFRRISSMWRKPMRKPRARAPAPPISACWINCRTAMSWWWICSGRSRKAPSRAITSRPMSMRPRSRGMVVDGAIRDLEGISPIDMGVYIRGVHPTPLRNIVLTGYNIPIRIGGATVMPGDVVFGDSEGVYFIPPEKVKEVVDKADITHIHDEWTKAKILSGKYKSTDIYPTPRDPALKKEYEEYLKQHLGK